jgi:hypothetical protein
VLENDLGPLQPPYTAQEMTDPTNGFLQRIGVQVQAVCDLEAEIVADLDETNFGIGWWNGVSTQRRILTSDQLVISVRSVATGLRDARLHHLEARAGWAGFADRFWASGPGPNPQILIAHPESPVEDLPRTLAELHVAGFFRAVGSTLDCLGATIVGVLGLPLRILTTGFGEVLRYLNQVALLPAIPPEHLAFLGFFQQAMAAAGPVGWTQWALDMRNMLVHRGRRLEPVFIAPIAAGLLVPHGDRLRVQHLLPVDPSRQEIEVLREGNSPFDGDLREHADETLTGIFGSLVQLTQAGAANMLDVWRQRRANPQALPQPLDKQWPNLASSPATGFVGYQPNTAQLPPGGQVMLGPTDTRRLQAGALLDPDRPKWAVFP